MLTKSIIVHALSSKLKAKKLSLFKLLGISLISSGLVVVQPLLMQKLIDEALIPKQIDGLYFWVSVMVILALFSMVITAINQYQYTQFSTRLLFDFRTDIFERLFLHKKGFFQKYQMGDVLSRLEGDISEIQRFGTDSIFALTTATFGMVGALFVVFSFDALLALFVMILLPFEFMLLKPLYPQMTQKTKTVRESGASIASFMIETVRYMLFLKRFNHQTIRVHDLRTLQRTHTKNILSQQKLQILFTQIPTMVALLGRTLILIYVGMKIVNNQMQVGELIACITYFGMVLGPIQTYLGIMNGWPKVKVSFQRLSEILPEPESKKEFFIAQKPTIEFKDIGFSFGNTCLYENLNLYIPYGKKVVIQGQNGAGKSTLFELLMQTQALQCGNIYIHGMPLKQIDTKSLNQAIGYVEQHPVILASTLRENLNIAKGDALDSSLIEALTKVGLKNWFTSLEHGLDTKLHESGMNLSGGQKQRIAIARVLLQQPSIILLDEHTASLDKTVKAHIDVLLDELFGHTTRIIISHEPSVANAKCYRLENRQLQEVI